MKRDFTVLGISLTHEASAALVKNGHVVAVAAEERFSRIKNDISYPKQAIDFCLRWSTIDPRELSCVVLAGQIYPYETFKYHRESQFSVDDWVHEQHAYWYPKLIEKRQVSYDDAFQSRKHLKADLAYDPSYHNLKSGDILPLIKKMITDQLGVSPKLIRTVPHERCHQYYAYFASPVRRDGVVLTCEGSGDYSNGTVSLATSHKITEKSATKENHVAHLYRHTTLLLGMKPNQHEYKVMGLAPYANEHEQEKVFKKLQGLFTISGLDIVKSRPLPDYYFSLQDLFEGCRFDGIAGGVQQYVEEVLCKWLEAICAKLNTEVVYFSGGVAQNIKAGKAMSELPSVRTLSVMPISGDGSVALGAAYLATAEHFEIQGVPLQEIEALSDVYLGPSYAEQEVTDAIEKGAKGRNYQIIKNPHEEWVVERLIRGDIIARFSGRMEFGQRALGNRSILSDPRKYEVVDRLNTKIKHRDFWMPFTPTLLSERADDYIINTKKLFSPFMTMAFDSTEQAQKDFPAALHPADKTVRPQILEEKQNPAFYRLIKTFERRTSVGGIVNTSFNLHGEPIVCTPADAVDVFNRSGIDILLFDQVALAKTSLI